MGQGSSETKGSRQSFGIAGNRVLQDRRMSTLDGTRSTNRTHYVEKLLFRSKAYQDQFVLYILLGLVALPTAAKCSSDFP